MKNELQPRTARPQLVAGLALFCALCACAPANPDKHTKPGTVAVFDCEQEIEIVVDIQPETAWLFLPGQTVALPHIRTGSGSKYSNGAITFWNKGGEALLALPGEKNYRCQENRARTIWEEAKLRGVDFRATGNEPGWHLEIGPDKILLVSAYGQQRETFPIPVPVSDQATRQTTYRTGDLEILLQARTCRDSMSGESFETTVTLTRPALTLKGCGRPLH